MFTGPTYLRVPFSYYNPAPRRSKGLCFTSPNPQTMPAALFRVTHPPNDASSFVSCHPPSKRCQQLFFVSPTLQTMPAASFRVTQPPNDASSFVPLHPVSKRCQQLRFVSPSPQTKQAASFHITWPQMTPAVSICITQHPNKASGFVLHHPNDTNSLGSHTQIPRRCQQLHFA